jgi:release factor glutamine methyltransferase
MTIRETLQEGSARLAAAGVETPALDSSLLLAEVLHTGRAALIINGGETLSEKERREFLVLIRRRIDGECAAYILGRKEFRGLEFTVNPGVLVPRPDTEILVEAALEQMIKEGGPRRVLDLCTGSGAVAIALKHEKPDWEVWASDISAKALDVAKANAKNLLGSPTAIHFLQADLLDPTPPSSLLPPLFSLIVSNPPYVASAEIETLAPEVRMEPRIALDGGADGLDLIRRIIPQAKRRLAEKGTLLIEADPRQMKAIALILKENDFRNLELYKDLAGRERVIGGSLPQGDDAEV